MIKKIKYLFVTLCALISIITILHIIDYKNLKTEITSQLNQIAGVNFKINGKVRKSFITSSSITIEKVKLQVDGFKNKESIEFNIKKIKIIFTPFSKKISKILFYSPNLSYNLNSISNNKTIDNINILEYIHKIADKFITNDIEFHIKNGIFRLTEDNYRYLELKQINSKGNYDFKNNFFDSNIDFFFHDNQIESSIKFDKTIKIITKSDIFNLDINLNNNNFLSFNNKNLEGEFKLNIKNISLMSELFLPLSNMGRILNANHNPIIISGKLIENDQDISLINGKIISNIINGHISGDLPKNNDKQIALKFDIKNLRLMDLFNTQKAALKKVYKTDNENYKANINNKYNIEFNIKDLYLNKENKIKNLKITVKDNKQKLTVKSNLIKIGSFVSQINGNLYFNFRNFIFNGNIKGEGKKFDNIFQYAFKELGIYKNIKDNFHSEEKYKFDSNIELTPYSVFVKKSTINIDDRKISGSILIDSSKPDKNVEAILTFNNFAIKVSKRNNLSLIDKSFKLTTINHHYKLLILLKNTKFYNYFIDNINFNLILDQNYFNLNNLSVKSPNINFSSNLDITLNDKEPKLNLSFKAQKISFQKYSDLGNIFFAIPSLESFVSEIYIDIKNLIIQNLQTKDLKIISTLKKSPTLNITQNNLKIYDGNFNHHSKIYLGKTKSINSKFKLVNGNLQKITDDTIGLNTIKSNSINLAGYLSTQGQSNKDFIKNSNSAMKFNSKKIEIENFGLKTLQKKLLSKQKSKNIRINSKKILEQGSSEFQNLQGNIKIDSKKQENSLSATISSYGIVASATSTFNISKKSFNLLSKFKFYVIQEAKPILLLFALNANKNNKIYNTSQIDSYLKNLYESLYKKSNN